MSADKTTLDNYPTFSELPEIDGERHAWDVWGRADQIGSLNFLGPAQVRSAGHLVQSGRVISLTCPLNQPDPGPFSRRSPYQHVEFKRGNGRDDRIDGFFPQFTSQWDGLRHIRFRQHGFWGGRQDEDLDVKGELGIEHWSRRGVIGRGVLLDFQGFQERRGKSHKPNEHFALTPALLDEIAAEQRVELRAGDILIIRTGWLEWFLKLSAEERLRLQGTLSLEKDALASPGLDPRQPTAAWLWDHRIAAVAADNPAVEALPVDKQHGFLHYRLIPLLGLPLGEMWLVHELASACAEMRRYDFLLMSAVMDIPKGVGSPANAYAVL